MCQNYWEANLQGYRLIVRSILAQNFAKFFRFFDFFLVFGLFCWTSSKQSFIKNDKEFLQDIINFCVHFMSKVCFGNRKIARMLY